MTITELQNPPAEPTPTPAATPPAADSRELTELRKQHEGLVYKMRMTEKELLTERDRANAALTELETAKKSGPELLRLKLAYEAGVPSRFLNLVTGVTEVEIKDQIKTITESLLHVEPAPVLPAPVVIPSEPVQPTPADPAQPQVLTPPRPSGTPGESWIERYMKSAPEEQQKMRNEVKEQGDKFQMT